MLQHEVLLTQFCWLSEVVFHKNQLRSHDFTKKRLYNLQQLHLILFHILHFQSTPPNFKPHPQDQSRPSMASKRLCKARGMIPRSLWSPPRLLVDGDWMVCGGFWRRNLHMETRETINTLNTFVSVSISSPSIDLF